MNPGSQDDKNTGQQFAKSVNSHFGDAFSIYAVENKGFGLEMYFNNYALVQRVGNCQVRFVCDREEIYLEVADLSAPEMYRQPGKPNLWFDASVLSAYLAKTTSFSWFYDYAGIPLDAPDRAERQLAWIARKMHPFWANVQDLFGVENFAQEKDRLVDFREKHSRASWQSLGWQDVSRKGNAIVLGHFPEFMDRARETGAKFLGIAPQVWVTLQRDELRWVVTKQFLDSAWKAKSAFILATEVRSPTSYFARELQYLVSLGKSG